MENAVGKGRPGPGRPKGRKNSATLERETMIAKASEAELARRQVVAASDAGKPLAREILEQFMHVFAGMAARVQPTPENEFGNQGEFIKWAKLACKRAAELAPFQSPKFKATMFMDPRDLRNTGAPAALPPPQNVIEGTVVKLKPDPLAGARIYLRMLDGDGDERAAS